MVFSGDTVRRYSCDKQEVLTNSMMNMRLAECMPATGKNQRLCRQQRQEVRRATNSSKAGGMERDKKLYKNKISGI